ncbi:MAG TPA: uroporphyrinogen decarboxylase [Isosphaeraceae bacterium]|jgi:uroporphyrinogen decarboxylase|nr:uroporphyrinogen decarboxylase [Isosphaeraceae bacterium]
MTKPDAAVAKSSPLEGLRVVALESRMAGPLAEMIARHGGVAVEAPALREVPLGENPAALEFARRLLAGAVDAVVFLTGVGARYLAQEIEAEVPLDAFRAALAKVRIVARGPKPQAVLREWGVPVAVPVPEPNTWHEVLAAIDASGPIAGLRVAVQEYGQPNPEFIQGLEARGAAVTRVPVYRWALPDDTAPLRAAIRELADGRAGAVLFTSAQQVVHLLQVAAELGVEPDLRKSLNERVIIGSIGPTTSETLRARGLPVDIVPEHPKMGHLVASLAAGWRAVGKASARRIEMLQPKPLPPPNGRLDGAPFLKACRREPVEATPIWLMRQAGRYMPEYREVRSKVGFLDLCKTPELACEVTVTAAERLGVDAAILFADILLILEPLGFDLEFSKGEGPVIHNPVREAADVDRVRPLDDPSPLGYVYEAVRQIRGALSPTLPLIGFAGAPFTLACYAIEGGSSRHYETAKAFMHRDPGAWDVLLSRLVDATALYLNAQADAGAQVLQVFDSWVGTLAPDDYRRFVQPHMRRLFDSLTPGIPTIHFGTDTGSLLELQRDAGGSVIGLDWRVDLGPTWDRLGPGVAVQGNLDPALLFAPFPAIESQARRVLDQAAGRPGHVFNLGHGILPGTPVDHVLRLIDFVHEYRG